MEIKIVSQLDKNCYFVGGATAFKDILGSGFLLPAGCIDVAPPDVPDGKRAKWDKGKFIFEAIPTPPDPPKPPEPTPEEKRKAIELQRQVAYQNESDMLFFMWQRGEGTEAEWLLKIAEIKARYPYPEA